MNRKNLTTKVISMAAAASMAATLFPTSVFAVTGDSVAKDGVYESTKHVSRVDDEDDEWIEYDVKVAITVEDGKIAKMDLTPSDEYDSSDGDLSCKSYFKSVNSGKKGVQNKLVGQAATQNTINSWDSVSGATRTYKAVKEAALEAIESAEEASEAEIDTTALEQAIEGVAEYTESDYTKDSWQVLQDALANANSVLEAKESQEAVDAAEVSLNAAIEALVKAEKEYKYAYAALTYQEYWSGEDVLAGDSNMFVGAMDTNGEYDKGAFDTVTRATSNHGLHRGNFQQDVTIYDTEGNAYHMSYWDGKTTIVLTDGTSIGFSRGTITLPSGETKTMDHYQIMGIKYVPVKVASEDYDAFKEAYTVVENGDTLAGGYGEGQLTSYSGLVAAVDENTNGLKEATKNKDGTFSFGERQIGTGSGIEGAELKTEALTPVVQSSSSFGDFIRMDVKENYADVAEMMQTVEWTYYGDGDTALAHFGTKFAADNWMHKSMGIELGLTDSLRCQLPEGYDGTGKWEVTIYALGYADTTMTINVTADDIHVATPVSDTSALEEAIAKAEALDQSLYTEDSWSDMQKELEEAKEDLEAAANGKTSQESVDESTTHLNAAIEALVKNHDHEYGEWTVTKLPSAENAPQESRTCSICNKVEVRDIETQPGINMIAGTPYVYDEDNNFVTNGTPSVNGVKYFVQDGIAQTGLLKLANWQMYADPETYELAAGLKEIDGKTYLFDKNGVEILKSRTEVIDGRKYWFQEDGSLMSGWCTLGSWKMYFDPETFEAAIGVKEIEGTAYLFDANGVLYEGNGTPVVNGKKYFVQNGKLKSGWLKLANWQMYFDPETYAAATGVTKIDGKAYLFDKNGVEVLKSRTEVIDGKKYWFQPDGSLMSGWCKLGNWTMYFDPETYVAATGTVLIDGDYFQFDSNGVLIAG